MRQILWETQKVWRKRTTWWLLLVVLLLQLGQCIYNDKKQDIPLAAYRKWDQACAGFTEKEKAEYVQQYYDFVQGIALVEQVQVSLASRSEFGQRMAKQTIKEKRETYEKYYTDWKEGEYLTYTDTLEKEIAFADEIYKRWQAASQYKEYIQEIDSQEETLQISIFQKKKNQTESYSEKSIHNIVQQYQGCKKVTVHFFTFEWLIKMLHRSVTDGFIIMFLVIIAGQMMYEEKKKSLFAVIKSTPEGRLSFILAKVVLVFVNAALVTAILYGVLFLYYGTQAGWAGFGNAVQGCMGLQSCPYVICAWQYVVWMIASKCLVFGLLSLLVLLMEIVTSQYIWSYIAVFLVMTVSILMYYLLPAVSNWQWLHYCNLFSALQTEVLWGDVILLKWKETPVAWTTVFLIGIVAAMIMLIIAIAVCFVWKRNIVVSAPGEYRYRWKQKIKKIWHRKNQKGEKNKGKKKRITSQLWFYEWYKMGIMNRGFLIIGALLLWFTYEAFQANCYLTPNELRYQQYMKEFKGELTKEKCEKILQEKIAYEKIIEQKKELRIKYHKGEISKSQKDSQEFLYDSELAFYPAFKKFYQRYLYVKQQPGAEFVYETGYDKLFGKKDGYYVWSFFLLIGTMGFVLIPLKKVEEQKGLTMLIRATPLGREYLKECHTKMAEILLVGIYGFFFLSRWYIGQKTYGVEGLFASANSLPMFSGVYRAIPIGAMVLGYMLITVLFLYVIVMGLLEKIS